MNNINKIKKEVSELFKNKIKYHIRKPNKNGTIQLDHQKTWKDNPIVFSVFDIIDSHMPIKNNTIGRISSVFIEVIMEHIESNKYLNEKIEKSPKNVTKIFLKYAKQYGYNDEVPKDLVYWQLKGRYDRDYEFVKNGFNKDEIIKNKNSLKKTHIFEEKNTYKIKDKIRKSSKMISSEIIKPIDNFIQNKNDGLFLCTAPTGSGKSYQITKLIINEMINNPNQKILFITDRVENLINPFKTLKKEINESEELTSKDKDYLKSQMVLIEGQEDALSAISIEQIEYIFSNIITLILNRNIKTSVLNENNLRSILKRISETFKNFHLTKDSLKNIKSNKEIKRALNDNLSKEKSKIMSELRSILKELSKTSLIESLSNESKDILSNIFAADAIAEHQVSFLTTAKILLPMGGAVHKSFNLETLKDAIIIIDEISAQKKVLEKRFLDIPSYNSNKHIAKILTIKNIDMTNTGIFKTIESDIKELKTELLMKEFKELHAERRFSYTKETIESTERASIFYDGKFGSEITLDNTFLSFNSSSKNKMNEIVEIKADNNKKDIKFIDYLKKLENFIDNTFSSSVIKMSDRIMEKNPDLSIDQAMKEVFSLLHIETENDEKEKLGSLFNRVMSNSKIKKQKSNIKSIDNISGYKNNIRITKFTDDGYSNSFVNFETNSIKFNSNIFLLSLCLKNKVIGLSATALSETNINNFDIDFFKENIDNFIVYTEKEVNSIKKELDYKNKTKGIVYDIKIIENSISSNMFDDKQIKNKFQDLGIEGFKEDKLKELGQTIDLFATKKHSRYMVAFASRKSNDYIETINKYLEKSGKSNVKVFGMISEDIKEKQIFNEIEKHLDKNIKNKAVVLTTYQTASSGLNLQRNKGTNDKNSFICLNKKFNNEKLDIDTIYLDNPTQLFVTSLYDSNEIKDKKNHFTKVQLEMIIHLKELLSGGTISYADYDKYYRQISKAKSIRDQVLNNVVTNAYKETHDKSQNLMAELRQTVGRMLRTNNRCKETNIYISRSFVTSLNEYDYNEKINLEVKEMSMLIDITNKEKKTEKNVSYKKEAEKATKRSTVYINNLLRYINMPYSENPFKQESQKKTIIEWEKLREWVLSNGIYLNKKEIENNLSLKKLTFKVEKNQKYIFESNGSFDIQKNFEYGKGKTIDESSVSLNLIHKNIELRNHFNNKGYITEFNKEFEYALSPIMMNNIYKGAIGEEVFKFIAKKYKFKTEDLPLGKYEKADFLMAGSNIGIDAKHWIKRYQTEEEKEYFFLKAEKKLEIFDRIIYVNTFSDKSEISYTDENGFEVNKKDAKIAIVKGLISSENGKELENTALNILELKKWINN